MIGTTQRVLIEGFLQKIKLMIIAAEATITPWLFSRLSENYKPGRYVDVFIERSTTATLIGKAVV